MDILAPKVRQQDRVSVILKANIEWLIIAAGMLFLAVPTGWTLIHGIWASDKQGHGPVVLAVSIWLLYRQWGTIQTIQRNPSPMAGWTLMAVGSLLYIIGRSQDISIFEVGSFIVFTVAVLLIQKGPKAVTAAWFGLFFMAFLIPLPGTVVDTLTQPMKLAVSYVTEYVLYNLGYPISRSGVILQIGQYQLLVADACAGLNTLFTLEALGLLYLNLIRHESLLRNVALATLIVPISFIANVIRVISLTLITYYLGDEAGQGFLHGFAGMVLFMAALTLIIASDSILRAIIGFLNKKNTAISIK